jgi:hypothetical protein
MLNEQKHEKDGVGVGDVLCVEQPVVTLINVEPSQRAVFTALINRLYGPIEMIRYVYMYVCKKKAVKLHGFLSGLYHGPHCYLQLQHITYFI